MDAVAVNSQCFDRPKFRLAGDRGLLVEFGDAITPEINQTVRAMTFALETAAVPGVREVIPTYRSVVIVYDPLTTAPSLLRAPNSIPLRRVGPDRGAPSKGKRHSGLLRRGIRAGHRLCRRA